MMIEEQPTQYFPPVRRTSDLHFPANEQTSRPSGRRLFWLFLFGCLLLSLLLTGVSGLAYSSPYLLPGTTVMGIDVGGLSINDTAVSLGTAWQQESFTLEKENDSWTVTPADLGLSLDPLATARKAHAYGRSPAAWLEWLKTGTMITAPVYELDTAVTLNTLQTLAPEIEQSAVNASIHVVNGQAQATPATPGFALNSEATVDYLVQHQTAVLAHGRLPLSYATIQPAITDVSSLIAELNQLLGTTIVIQAYDPVSDEAVTWNIPPDTWGNWIAVEISPADLTRLQWHLETQAARNFLNTKSAELGETRFIQVDESLRAVVAAVRQGQTAVSLRIYHTPSQYTVQAGETLAAIGRTVGIPYPWLQQANPGLNDLNPGQIINIPSPDDLLPYPVIPHKRIVVSISQQTTKVYENGQLKWDWPASTGITASPTAPGIFQVQTHVDNAYAANWNLWMPNFMGIYRPVPTSDFMNGFHGFPTRDGYNLLWTNNLGTQVTYGCILLSNENAQTLYNWAEQGVVVEILP